MLHHLRRPHRFMMNYSRALLQSILRPVILFLVILALTAINIGAMLFWFCEHAVNPNLHSYLDALYFTTATMTTVGYGDITPVTSFGKILAMGFMLLGTAIFVSFTAVLSTLIMEIEMRAKESKP